MIRTRTLVLLSLTLAAASTFTSRAEQQPSAPAQSADTSLLSQLRWRSIGPDRGGRSIAVSGVKGRPQEAYFGAVGGGLWKTTDGGNNWLPVTDGQIKSASVGAVAVSESNPSIVIIGMGESCIRGNIMPGDGVYKSSDAGKTWTHIGFSESQAISRVRIHPTNPDTVYVASFGKYGAPSEERGVFKSTDGGKSWRKTLYRDDKTGAVDISIDRRKPERDVRRPVGGVSGRISDVIRRPRQRTVQVDRRRRHMDGDHAQPGHAGRCHRTNWRGGLRR